MLVLQSSIDAMAMHCNNHPQVLMHSSDPPNVCSRSNTRQAAAATVACSVTSLDGTSTVGRPLHSWRLAPMDRAHVSMWIWTEVAAEKLVLALRTW